MPVRTEKRLRGVAVSTDQTLRMFPPCKSSGGAAGSDAPGSGAPGSGANENAIKPRTHAHVHPSLLPPLVQTSHTQAEKERFSHHKKADL